MPELTEKCEDLINDFLQIKRNEGVQANADVLQKAISDADFNSVKAVLDEIEMDALAALEAELEDALSPE